MSFVRNVRADLIRSQGSATVAGLARATLTERTFRPTLTLRLAQGADALSWPLRTVALPLTRALHRRVCTHSGIELPWKTSIGPGLLLAHAWGLVVSRYATIGANVTLYHGVTIGTKNHEYPVIEDDVWIGAHALVVGRVRVGRGAIIGPGTTVTKDVPPLATVVGNPGRVVRENGSPDVRNRAPLP